MSENSSRLKREGSANPSVPGSTKNEKSTAVESSNANEDAQKETPTNLAPLKKQKDEKKKQGNFDVYANTFYQRKQINRVNKIPMPNS